MKFSDLYEVSTEKNTGLIPYSKTISVAKMVYKAEGDGACEESLSSYKVLRKGDIAFEGHKSKVYRYGRFVLNDIGTGLMSTIFTAFRPKQEMPLGFWKQYIHYAPVMDRILSKTIKSGVMMNSLVTEEFIENTIAVPVYTEQEQIGSLFSRLDRLIELESTKLDKYRGIKQGLQGQML